MFLFLHHDSLSNNNLKDAVIKHIADVFFTNCSTLDLVMWVHTDNEMSFRKMRLLLSSPTCVCSVCPREDWKCFFKVCFFGAIFTFLTKLEEFFFPRAYPVRIHRLGQNNSSLRAVEYLIQKLSTCSNIQDIHVEYVWAHSSTVITYQQCGTDTKQFYIRLF